MRDYIIETEGLTKLFGSKLALDQLTLQIPKGGVQAVIGSNGAGKSTLFRILLGFIEPSKGWSTVLGCESQNLSPEIRERVGLVHEEHTLPDWLQVDEVVAMQKALYHRWSDRIYKEVIGHYRIQNQQKVNALSRGERAGLSLALALAQRPELLILDEPTLGLDVVAKQAFLESLMFAGEADGCTIIYCSHQMDEVERLADNLIILVNGKLAAIESPEAFCQRVSYWATDLPYDPKIIKQIDGLLHARDIEGMLHFYCEKMRPNFEIELKEMGATWVNQNPIGLERAVNAFLAKDHHRPGLGV